MWGDYTNKIAILLCIYIVLTLNIGTAIGTTDAEASKGAMTDTATKDDMSCTHCHSKEVKDFQKGVIKENQKAQLRPY